MRDGPDFLCIGQQKAGTTWLYDQLQFHPCVWTTTVKELHYLVHAFPHRKTTADMRRASKSFTKWQSRRLAENMRPGDERDRAFFATVERLADQLWSLDAYAELFAQKGDQISGDFSPSSAGLKSGEIAALAARFPGIRAILLVRDPIERAWSNINRAIRAETLKEADLHDPEKVKRLITPGLIHQSQGTRILKDWAEHVPVQTFLFDDIGSNPLAVLQGTYDFLGLQGAPAIAPDFNRKRHHTKVAMPEPVRTSLIDTFADEVRAAASVFGGAAALWPARYGL
jgi:hypothetical protein